jgi:hypothetical protein
MLLTATDVKARNTGVVLHALPVWKESVPITMPVMLVVVKALSELRKEFHALAMADTAPEEICEPFVTLAAVGPVW